MDSHCTKRYNRDHMPNHAWPKPHAYTKSQQRKLPLSWCTVQGDAEGRLLSYSPATGETLVLADNIWLANGVAVSHDESFVVVVSTGSMRLYKYWLTGGKVNVFPSYSPSRDEDACY